MAIAIPLNFDGKIGGSLSRDNGLYMASQAIIKSINYCFPFNYV